MIFFIFALLLVPASAFAHTGAFPFGFHSGFVHPMSGWDHVLAMIAVGLWSARIAGKKKFLLPLGFVSAVAVGGLLSWLPISIGSIEAVVTISVAALGLLLASLAPVGFGAGLSLVAFFGLFHGLTHAAAPTTGGFGVSSLLGLVSGTGLLHAAGLALGHAALRHRWTAALRLTGLGMACTAAAVWGVA